MTVDFKSMMDNLDFTRDQFLRPRDIIFVPTLGEGEGARRIPGPGRGLGSPGFHPHDRGLGHDPGGGVRWVACRGKGGWMRPACCGPTGKGQYRVIPVDLQRLFGAADMQMNVPVLAGDILFVPSAQQSVGGKIYLLGEVSPARHHRHCPLDRETQRWPARC
jgi:hypothetical protein